MIWKTSSLISSWVYDINRLTPLVFKYFECTEWSVLLWSLIFGGKMTLLSWVIFKIKVRVSKLNIFFGVISFISNASYGPYYMVHKALRNLELRRKDKSQSTIRTGQSDPDFTKIGPSRRFSDQLLRLKRDLSDL